MLIDVLMDLAYGPHGERNMLDLYVPHESAPPHPVVVCIHGGGWANGSRNAYGWLVAPLAARGMAAALMTYRFAPDWRCPAGLRGPGPSTSSARGICCWPGWSPAPGWARPSTWPDGAHRPGCPPTS